MMHLQATSEGDMATFKMKPLQETRGCDIDGDIGRVAVWFLESHMDD